MLGNRSDGLFVYLGVSNQVKRVRLAVATFNAPVKEPADASVLAFNVGLTQKPFIAAFTESFRAHMEVSEVFFPVGGG